MAGDAPPIGNVRYPETQSIAAESEAFVKKAASMYADDVQQLTDSIIGKSGRPYRHVPLDAQEKDALYNQLRQVDDPQLWGQILDTMAPKAALRWWRDAEQSYRAAQQPDGANGPDLASLLNDAYSRRVLPGGGTGI